MDVHKLVSTTFSDRASITGCPGKSVRMKLIPLPAGAGFIVNLTLYPEWSPIPVQLTSSLIVLCLKSTFHSIPFILNQRPNVQTICQNCSFPGGDQRFIVTNCNQKDKINCPDSNGRSLLSETGVQCVKKATVEMLKSYIRAFNDRSFFYLLCGNTPYMIRLTSKHFTSIKNPCPSFHRIRQLRGAMESDLCHPG